MVELTDKEYQLLKSRNPIDHVGIVFGYFLKSFPEYKTQSNDLIIGALNSWIQLVTLGRCDLGYGCFLIIEYLDKKHNII